MTGAALTLHDPDPNPTAVTAANLSGYKGLCLLLLLIAAIEAGQPCCRTHVL